MTLVCHHPELVSNPRKYFGTGPAWRENGVVIIPSTGVYLQADTSEDRTRTTLTINITVDHFRNSQEKSFNYSCLLVLAGEKELQTGGVESSEEVTVDPVGECLIYLVCIPNLSVSMQNKCPYRHHTQLYPFLPRSLQ